MKKMRRPVKSQGLRVRAYPVLAEAVESGVKYGLTRAYKYTDKPTREDMENAVVVAVMNDICERFDFDEDQL